MKKMIAVLFSVILSLLCTPLYAQTVETLDNAKAVDTLNDLVQINIDAYYAYVEAIDSIKSSQIKEQFIKFRDDHHQRINTLSEKVRELGGVAPKFSTDVKGAAMKYYTKLRGITGDVGIVKAMHTNELIARDHYQDALKLNFGSDIKDILDKHFSEEQQHVNYMDKTAKQLK